MRRSRCTEAAPVADERPRRTYPFVVLNKAQLHGWLGGETPIPAAEATIVGIMQTSSWQITATRSQEIPANLYGYGPYALEVRENDEEALAQLHDRRDLVDLLIGQVLQSPAADPTEPPRTIWTQSVALDALECTDIAEAEQLEAAFERANLPMEYIHALANVEEIDTFTRMSATTDLRYEKLSFVSAGEHGRWAIWLRLDSSDPNSAEIYRLRRVDDRWLRRLLEEFALDLVGTRCDVALAHVEAIARGGDESFPATPTDDHDGGRA